ncbi:MAG: ELM1/GtrOC1 family putative glycosyltransferase [Sedimenticolaceae bacterium]
MSIVASLPTPGDAPADAKPTDPPRVWLLLGEKIGDNNQVEVIADVLPWPLIRKTLRFRPPYDQEKPPFAVTIDHVDRVRSDRLEPPWPDLILTSGRRPSMAALWVREQARGRCRVALIGKPSGLLERFDLIVMSAQNRLPDRSNVLAIGLPPIHVDHAAIQYAADAWRARLAPLRRPLIALLVGGPTHPFLFDERITGQLMRQVCKMLDETGGSVYATTSRRTPAAVTEALESHLPPGSHLYRWQSGDADNPYLGLLGNADAFIVTGDSISMMMEVAKLGRPLAIFPLPRPPRSLRARLRSVFADLLLPPAGSPGWRRMLQPLGFLLYRRGSLSHPRDLSAIHDTLIQRGLAVWLGEPLPPAGRAADDELATILARINALLDPIGGAKDKRRSHPR